LAQSGREAPEQTRAGEPVQENEALVSPAPTREPVPPVLETLQPSRPEGAEETAEPKRARSTTEELGEAQHPRRGGILRHRRRGHISNKELVTCAVCKRTEATLGPEEAEAGGWILRGGLSLCLNCRDKGWRLPEAEGLPFRRPSARRTSG
jgi:hypothetical protein